MSSSLARMERRAARSRDEKKGGILQSAIHRAIEGMATDFANGIDRRLDTADHMVSDKFDEFFLATIPKIVAAHPGLDMARFRARLIAEASTRNTVGLLNGKKAFSHAQLFALPFSGSLHDIEAFVQVPGKLLELTRTFMSAGLAEDNTAIILSPVLMDMATAGEALPGQIRQIADSLQRPLSDPDADIVSEMKAILGISDNTTGYADRVTHRMLLGVRIKVSPVEADSVPDDGLSPGRMNSSSESSEVETWSLLANRLVPSGLLVSPPQTFSRGCTAMAGSRIVTALLLEAQSSGIDVSEGFSKLSLVEGNHDLVVTGYGDHEEKIGTVSVPADCAYADPEWLAEMMTSISALVVREATPVPPVYFAEKVSFRT